ncbi:MAG: MBL fold metallo-hydrolase [Deltaproteobacteria bacterium]|nr:MBL fold metallo-hydrolase [Deltaproteobacteria bacterium]MBW2071761.1 MBL fold metallo-hydrolase [Deltaproteobacteria bacterium]
MKVTFYGTRGSIPVPHPDYVEFGGNTPCILVTFSTGRVAVLDAGTGIRKLGNDLLAAAHEQYNEFVIGLSHTHWDHIQGFPFFKLANDPRRNITLAICGKDRSTKRLENIFATQMQRDYFPVPLDKIGARINFWQPDFTEYVHPRGVEIVAAKHNHPGGAYGYRLTEGGKTLVYCTDVEHGDSIDPNVVALARNADLLIHDAQYTPEELKERKGWGHSSWQQAVDVAERAGVKRLALFHHDPDHPDAFLLQMEAEIQKDYPEVFVAREGSEVIL